MNKYLVIVVATFFALLTGRAQGGENPFAWIDETMDSIMIATLEQEPTELHLLLGTEENDFELIPNKLTLEVGKPYKLVIKNATDVAHVLALPEFSAIVRRSSAPAFPYLEAKIDVAAGETVEWYFVPPEAGIYKMGCAERAHAEAGMTGRILVN